MKSPQRHSWNSESIIRLSLWIVVSAIIIAGLIALWPYLGMLSDVEQIKAWVESTGPWAPLAYIAFQILQVMAAPISGNVVGFVGGLLFETFWATIYTLVGTTIGLFIVFSLSRKYGRKLLKLFVGEKYYHYLDTLDERNVKAFLLLMFLLPILPDPVLGYIGGLTKVRIRTLLLVSVLARAPSIYVTSFVSSKIGQGEFWAASIVGLVALIVGIVIYRRRTLILKLVDRYFR